MNTLIAKIKALFSEGETDMSKILHELAAKVEAIETHLLKNNDSLPHKYVVPTTEPAAVIEQPAAVVEQPAAAVVEQPAAPVVEQPTAPVVEQTGNAT